MVDAHAQFAASRNIRVGISVLLSLVLLFSGWRAYAYIVKPLQELHGVMNRIGERLDFTLTMPVYNAKDAIGGTATAFNALVERIRHSLVGINESCAQVANYTSNLALNATIEAARAGEMSRGFAVVVDEVRKLAERTAVLTGEIDQVIRGINDTSRQTTSKMGEALQLVDSGVERSDEAIRAVGLIEHSSGAAMSMVMEIAEAIREQGRACNAIAGKWSASLRWPINPAWRRRKTRIPPIIWTRRCRG
ncbi:methyl-accepting chemotaxis protein [uncultured Aquitalea sp.]|uniref:methyl-accepting chemotaxis protein n=1 Tax=uncultured Aquitalea sp. TaxID=540272 RepID=UPI0025ECED6C|nr:methyl-accepting chemotaxis protein [uncultured Aquitalea sp.]